MDRKEFLARSFVLAMKYFVGLGPLIGGFYLLAATRTSYEGHFWFAVVFFIFSYVFGIFPAFLTAAVWCAFLFVVSYVSMDRLLKMPLTFLLGSFVISGLAGYGAELLWEHNFILRDGITYSDVATIAGCAAGFMAANGLLKFVENQNLAESNSAYF